MNAARLIGLDWGTTACRAYRIGADGAVLARLVDGPGILRVENGAFGAASGYAQLHRSGAGAVVNASPVTEFLTASSLANKDFVFVGGGGGTYLFMNRIGAGFAGTDAAPVNMANWFAAW